MIPSRVSAVLVLAAGLLLTSPASAVVNAFLKIDGVDGGSTDPAHHAWIEALSTDFAISPAGRSAENVNHGSFNIVKLVDRSSPALSMAASSKKPFPTATIEARGSRWVLTNVIVSGVVSHFSGGSGEENPKETVTFEYGGLQIAYQPQTSGTPTPSKSSLAAADVALASTAPTISKVTPSAASAAPGHVLTFTVEGSGNCNRSRIDFGDGSPVVEYPMVAGKSQPAPTHAFAKGGTFEVKAYGFADSWAKLTQASKASDHACTGHATTNVTITPAIAQPSLQRK